MTTSRVAPVLVSLLLVTPVSVYAVDATDRGRNQKAVPIVSAAGRNLRAGKSKSCRITVPTRSLNRPGPAQIVLMLPPGAQLLNARVVRPNNVIGSCNTRGREAGSGKVRCTLNRLAGNKPVTVIARFHQLNGKPIKCSGYLTKQVR